VLAWLVGSFERPVIGELWLFPSSGDPRLVANAPGFLPTGPTCTHAVGLRWTGRDSVTLDIRASCDAALLPRAPERSVSVLSPWRTVRVNSALTRLTISSSSAARSSVSR